MSRAFQNNPALTIVIISTMVALSLTTVAVSGLLSANQRIPVSGAISTVNVAVYGDSQLTNPVTSIEWGTIAPGETATKTVYIKNTGNLPVTLTLATENWDPTGSDSYLTLTWNYSGYPLQADGSIAVTLSLQVSSNIQDITAFNFDIVITGTQTS